MQKFNNKKQAQNFNHRALSSLALKNRSINNQYLQQNKDKSEKAQQQVHGCLSLSLHKKQQQQNKNMSSTCQAKQNTLSTQQNATEFLLRLSEDDHQNSYYPNSGYNYKENDIFPYENNNSMKIDEEIQYTNQIQYQNEHENKSIQRYHENRVTPWTRVQFKLCHNRNYSRSKTSMLLPPCGNGKSCKNKNNPGSTQQVKIKIKQKKKHQKSYQNKQNKQNRHFYYSKQKNSQKRVALLQKCSNQIKNSYSTYTRYNESEAETKGIYVKEFLQSNISVQNKPSAVLVHCQSDRNKNKSRISRSEKQKKFYKDYTNQQNLSKLQVIMPRKSVNRPYEKIHTVNDEILCISLKQNIRRSNITQKSSQKVQNIYETKKQHLDRQKVGTSQHKSTNSHHNIKSLQAQSLDQIKKRILQSIKKQSIVKLNTEGDSIQKQGKSSSKKIVLAKYLKYSQSKKYQNNINSSHGNSKIDSIINGSYQSSNPITRHLYEKYKKLIQKCG